MRILVQ